MRRLGIFIVVVSLLLIPYLYFKHMIWQDAFLGVAAGGVLYVWGEIRRRENQSLIVGLMLLIVGVGLFAYNLIVTRNFDWGMVGLCLVPGIVLTIYGEIARRVRRAERMEAARKAAIGSSRHYQERESPAAIRRDLAEIALRHPNPGSRIGACTTLSNQFGESAADILREVLYDDPVPTVRTTAIDELRKFRTEDAVSAIRIAYQTDDDPWVRSKAAKYI